MGKRSTILWASGPLLLTDAAAGQDEAAPAPTGTGASKEGTTFRPVEGGAGDDAPSGELLLVEAYAAMWILAFALIFLSLRRQKRLDERIERLREDLTRARDGDS